MRREKFHQPDIFTGEIITPELLSCVNAAGDLAIDVRRRGLSVASKSTKEDIVTQGDLAVSEMLREKLSRFFPGIVFVDEEVAGSIDLNISEQDLVAIIDPIDGTTNYYNAGKHEAVDTPLNPNWAISVGIAKRGKLVAGAIYQPALRKLFYAEKGCGAYVNGTRLHVSSTRELSNARLSYDFPYPKDQREHELAHRVFPDLIKRVSFAERLGSAVVETMDVAQGKSDLCLFFRVQPWDVAAAVVIVEEAGGVALNVAGEPFSISSNRSLMLTNGVLEVSPAIQIMYEKMQ